MARLPTARFNVGDLAVLSNPLDTEYAGKVLKITGIDFFLWAYSTVIRYETTLGHRLDGEIREMTDKEKLNHKIAELEKIEKELQKQIAALREEVNKPAKLEDGCYITKFNVGNSKDRDRIAFIYGDRVKVFSLDGAMQLECSLNNNDIMRNYEGFVKVSSLDPLRK